MFKCPICEAQAGITRSADKLMIACESCGPYDASGSIIDGQGILARKDRGVRFAALAAAKARAKPGDRPMIYSYDL